MTKVLVCGGRDYADRDLLFSTLDKFDRIYIFTTIITGGAKGADKLAHQWAAKQRIEARVYSADWERHGKMAGMLRNREMLKAENPDLVLAFPGGRGTADMVKISKKAGVEVIEIEDKKT